MPYLGEEEVKANQEDGIHKDKDHKVSPGDGCHGDWCDLDEHNGQRCLSGEAKSHPGCSNFHRL